MGKLFLVFVTQSWVLVSEGRRRRGEESSKSSLGKGGPDLGIFEKGSEKQDSKSGELGSTRKLFRYGLCSLPSLFCFWISIRFYFGV